MASEVSRRSREPATCCRRKPRSGRRSRPRRGGCSRSTASARSARRSSRTPSSSRAASANRPTSSARRCTRFADKGGRNVTLRPESTAAVCRAYVEHGMQSLPQPVKLFYIGPQFRYERPQKGRYRQFHQIGAELLGGKGAESDAEVLLMLVAFLRALGFTDLKVLLNTVGDAESRAALPRGAGRVPAPARSESLRGQPAAPGDQSAAHSRHQERGGAGAPRRTRRSSGLLLTDASRAHFATVRDIAPTGSTCRSRSRHAWCAVSTTTPTPCSRSSPRAWARRTRSCGGGAYEGLVEELGGPPTYGVGFAIGEDRLVDALPESFREKQKLQVGGVVVIRAIRDSSPQPSGQGDQLDVEEAAQLLAEELRRAGVPAVSLGEWRPRRPTPTLSTSTLRPS